MNNPHKELWDLYDEAGRALGRTVVRGDPLQPGEYHQVVQIWIRNGDGHFLIQKRAPGLSILPGIWATTAGSVLAGESPRSGAVRELEEELGLDVSEETLELLFHGQKRNSLHTSWLLERDVAETDLTLQEAEVSAVMWASPEKIGRMVGEGRFHDYGSEYFRRIFDHRSQRVSPDVKHSRR